MSRDSDYGQVITQISLESVVYSLLVLVLTLWLLHEETK